MVQPKKKRPKELFWVLTDFYDGAGRNGNGATEAYATGGHACLLFVECFNSFSWTFSLSSTRV